MDVDDHAVPMAGRGRKFIACPLNVCHYVGKRRRVLFERLDQQVLGVGKDPVAGPCKGPYRGPDINDGPWRKACSSGLFQAAFERPSLAAEFTRCDGLDSADLNSKGSSGALNESFHVTQRQ